MVEGIKKLEDGTLLVMTTDGIKKVSPEDRLVVRQGSGLGTYGEIVGDWRMVEIIFEACQVAFSEEDG